MSTGHDTMWKQVQNVHLKITGWFYVKRGQHHTYVSNFLIFDFLLGGSSKDQYQDFQLVMDRLKQIWICIGWQRWRDNYRIIWMTTTTLKINVFFIFVLEMNYNCWHSLSSFCWRSHLLPNLSNTNPKGQRWEDPSRRGFSLYTWMVLFHWKGLLVLLLQ